MEGIVVPLLLVWETPEAVRTQRLQTTYSKWGDSRIYMQIPQRTRYEASVKFTDGIFVPNQAGTLRRR